MNAFGLFALATLLGVSITGCAVGPDYRRPPTVTPASWHTQAPERDQIPLAEQWWRNFNDPILNQLIQDGLASNLDYRQALAKIKATRAEQAATIAAGLPAIDAKSTLSRRFNNSSAAGQSGGNTSGGGFGIGNQVINIFQLGFDAQWELDFFGGVRRAIEAADANWQMSVENSRDVLVSLFAEIAKLYIDLRNQQQQLAILDKNLVLQADSLHLTQVRQQAGLGDELAVAEAQTQLASSQAQRPNHELAIQQTIYALSVLVGREPTALNARLAASAKIPSPAHTTLPELPAALLKRRPDIRQAERQVALANAQVGIAIAEFYPKVNLAAFLGLQNMSITGFTPIGKSWSAASSVSMPLFNWGKLKANINSKTAQSEQSVLAYQQTVLNAFKDVEDALVSRAKTLERQQALTAQLTANRLGLILANDLYQRGLTSFLDVIQNQQTLLQTEQSLAENTASLSTTEVALYKALGGGWSIAANTP